MHLYIHTLAIIFYASLRYIDKKLAIVQVNSNSDSMSAGVYTGIHVHILNNLRAHKTSPSIITIRKFSNLKPNSDVVLLSFQTKFRNYVQQKHGLYIKFLNSVPQAIFCYIILHYYIIILH